MALGRRDLSLLTLPVGWDATELSNIALRDGTTYGAVAARVEAAIGALNAELRADSTFSSLVSYTDEPTLEYRVGASNGFELATEYGLPDAKRADTIGHMLPIQRFDRRLGWTLLYLEDARMAQIEADIADAVRDGRAIFRQRVMRRLLKRGDDSGATWGLGSTGYSPGFATAAASTGVDFTPPATGGTSFTSDHEHYNTYTGGAMTATMFAEAKADLREHGHEPPYEFMIGTSEEAAVRALTGFVPVDDKWVQASILQDRVVFSADTINTEGTYPIGAINDFRVWVVRGMPQYYGFAWKSYGPNSARNPLRIRLRPEFNSITFRAIPDPLGGNANYPLQNLMLNVSFGVGVGDRTNGVAIYNNNATWADGTAT